VCTCASENTCQPRCVCVCQSLGVPVSPPLHARHTHATASATHSFVVPWRPLVAPQGVRTRATPPAAYARMPRPLTVVGALPRYKSVFFFYIPPRTLATNTHEDEDWCALECVGVRWCALVCVGVRWCAESRARSAR